jgi:hypothetical protein
MKKLIEVPSELSEAYAYMEKCITLYNEHYEVLNSFTEQLTALHEEMQKASRTYHQLAIRFNPKTGEFRE